MHAAPLIDDDAITVRGYRTTAAGRTALDLATTLPFGAAVVVIDSALNDPQPHGRGARVSDRSRPTLLTLDELDAARQRRTGLQAHRRYDAVRAFVSAQSGSAGESLSRVTLAARGWPRPVLQQAFSDVHGRIGRVDFWWPCCGVIGEFDGYVKYSRGEFLRGDAPAEAVVREKRREDRLRAHPEVRGVARWMWSDVLAPSRLDASLSAAGLRTSHA